MAAQCIAMLHPLQEVEEWIERSFFAHCYSEANKALSTLEVDCVQV